MKTNYTEEIIKIKLENTNPIFPIVFLTYNCNTTSNDKDSNINFKSYDPYKDAMKEFMKDTYPNWNKKDDEVGNINNRKEDIFKRRFKRVRFIRKYFSYADLLRYVNKAEGSETKLLLVYDDKEVSNKSVHTNDDLLNDRNIIKKKEKHNIQLQNIQTKDVKTILNELKTVDENLKKKELLESLVSLTSLTELTDESFLEMPSLLKSLTILISISSLRTLKSLIELPSMSYTLSLTSLESLTSLIPLSKCYSSLQSLTSLQSLSDYSSSIKPFSDYSSSLQSLQSLTSLRSLISLQSSADSSTSSNQTYRSSIYYYKIYSI